MAEKIRAYFMRVSEDGEVYKGYFGEIENTLKAKQTFVGGTIQVISLNDGVDLICHDEGKILHLPPNRALYYDAGGKDTIYDFVAGNCLCVRHNDEGDFTSILDEDISIIQKFTKPIEFIAPPNLILVKEEDACVEWQEPTGDDWGRYMNAPTD